MTGKRLEELRYYFTGYGSPHDETILKLIEQNKRYREALENIRSVKGDENFDHYAYMMLEIIEWAEEALKESAE